MHDCMVARILGGPSASGFISLARSAQVGVFERPDMRLFSLLLPHLRRAMQTQMRMAPAGIGPESAVEALDRLNQGVLIVDAEARVVHANRAAEAILAKGNALGIDPSGSRRDLRAATPGQTRSLRRLIGEAATTQAEAPSSGGGVLRLVSDNASSLLLSVTPLRAPVAWNAARRPAALVLLSPADQDVSPRPEHLRALYNLTPAETAVASRIMRGDGIQAAARALQIAPNTLRTHLSRIFDKTGTRRQAELARLLQQVARLN
jgi:DNA-binding CsgD family transcriptional regulator